MQVINKNNKIHCIGCGSDLEYEPSDVKSKERSRVRGTIFRERVYYTQKYVTCPVCGRDINI